MPSSRHRPEEQRESSSDRSHRLRAAPRALRQGTKHEARRGPIALHHQRDPVPSSARCRPRKSTSAGSPSTGRRKLDPTRPAVVTMITVDRGIERLRDRQDHRIAAGCASSRFRQRSSVCSNSWPAVARQPVEHAVDEARLVLAEEGVRDIDIFADRQRAPARSP